MRLGLQVKQLVHNKTASTGKHARQMIRESRPARDLLADRWEHGPKRARQWARAISKGEK